jgi:hypothetical protein
MDDIKTGGKQLKRKRVEENAEGGDGLIMDK